jgi:hypothetical protein
VPIINYVPQDPTDTVIQGEQLRVAGFDARPNFQGNVQILDPLGALGEITQDADAFLPMNQFIEINRLSIRRNRLGGFQIRNNAGICTPCGEWVSLDTSPLLLQYQQATVHWRISGVTRDAYGAPLSGCAVWALETGRLNVGGVPVVDQETSDGSGNYALDTATNSLHQVIAYKSGPLAGISVNTVTPTQV